MDKKQEQEPLGGVFDWAPPSQNVQRAMAVWPPLGTKGEGGPIRSNKIKCHPLCGEVTYHAAPDPTAARRMDVETLLSVGTPRTDCQCPEHPKLKKAPVLQGLATQSPRNGWPDRGAYGAVKGRLNTLCARPGLNFTRMPS